MCVFRAKSHTLFRVLRERRFEYHRAKPGEGSEKTAASERRVDLSAFDGVIGLDSGFAGGAVVHVEGLATMETMVAFLDPLGWRVPIVPELKHITVGGAIAGVGIESGSARHGWFHQAVVACEVLTPQGSVLRATASNEHADLFHALPNSYGTLGYVLRATVRLAPSKRCVAVRTTVHASFADAAESMMSAVADEGEQRAEFVEGLWWSADKVTVTTTRYVDAPPAGERLSRFDGMRIYYRAVGEEGTLYMLSRDYYFRWDPDWFWNIPVDAGGALVRLVVPSRHRTSSTYKWIRSLWVVRQWHRLETLWKPMGQPFVQDWAVPWSKGVDFMREAAATTPLRPGIPYMLLPVKTQHNTALHYPTDKEHFYLNVGTYTEIDIPFQRALAATKHIDDLCLRKYEGIKMMYSSSFLDRHTFERVYGTLDPRTRDKVDPHHTRPSVYEKTAHPSVLGIEDLVPGY